MINFLSYDEYAVLEFMENEYALLEYEEKDLKRVWDIIGKAKGSDEKVTALISRMAKSITDREKAFRRGEAVVHIMGENPADRQRAAEFAKIFFDRARDLGLDVDGLLASDGVKSVWDESKYHGIMTLPTWSAVALWDHEITGQLSDGAWENSGPHDHWKFWNGLQTALGRPNVIYKNFYGNIKNGYNLAGLVPDLGYRMVKIGRMGQAMGRHLTSEEGSAAEYMPDTMEKFMEERHKNPNEQGNYYVKYLMALLPGDAERYYHLINSYTEANMRSDLMTIKTAMKTVGGR